jgi:hypothetical protein
VPTTTFTSAVRPAFIPLGGTTSGTGPVGGEQIPNGIDPAPGEGKASFVTDEEKSEGSPSWWTRARAARTCEHLAVGLEAATLTGPVLTDGSPVITVITGLLGLGLYLAAGRLRKKR